MTLRTSLTGLGGCRVLPAWGWILGGAFCAACLLSIAPQAVAQARALPSGRVPSAQLRHVAVDLQFDWGTRQAQAIAVLHLREIREPTRVSLDAAHLKIDSIRTEAGQILSFSHDGSERDDALRITLDRAYGPQEELRLHIRYRTTWVNQSDPNNLGGSTGKGLRFFSPNAVDQRRHRQIWVSGEPGASRWWLPGIDDPGMLRTAEITATLDRPLRLVSGGQLVSVSELAGQRQRWHWRIDTPHASHRTVFVVGEFLDHSQAHAGVPLHNLGYPLEMDGVRPSVARLPQMVAFLEDITGSPLPAPSYAQVFVQDLPWGHVAPGLAVQSENMVDDAGTHDDFQYLWHGLQAESLALQWFGRSLATADWSDLWLERALAHHVNGWWARHLHGNDEYLLWHLNFGHGTYHGDWASKNRHPVVNPRWPDKPEVLSGNHPYFHGANVLHMLRKEVGEEVWQQALRRYVKQHSGRLVRTADLQRAVEAVSGRELGWFFQQWVFGVGHPVFEVSRSHDATRGKLILALRQVQQTDSQLPHPQTTWFQGHMDFDIDGRVHRRWLRPQQDNVFEFDVSSEPRLVHADHEGSWLKELRFNKPLRELTFQLRSTTDALGRQWAQEELARIAQDKTTTLEQRDEIYAAFREVMVKPAWWRVRFNAVNGLRNLMAPASSKTAVDLDASTRQLLLKIIRSEGGWLRSAAIAFLGMTRDPQYAALYVSHLRDRSDRVINAAATALGRSGSPLAFDALAALPAHLSWKNQSLISALNGLAELKDPRGTAIALRALADVRSARWTLATPVWDYRLAAADTVVALGAAQAGTEVVRPLFEQALKGDDHQDIFSQLQLLAALGDPSTEAVFRPLRERFAHDAQALKALDGFYRQWQSRQTQR